MHPGWNRVNPITHPSVYGTRWPCWGQNWCRFFFTFSTLYNNQFRCSFQLEIVFTLAWKHLSGQIASEKKCKHPSNCSFQLWGSKDLHQLTWLFIICLNGLMHNNFQPMSNVLSTILSLHLSKSSNFYALLWNNRIDLYEILTIERFFFY